MNELFKSNAAKILACYGVSSDDFKKSEEVEIAKSENEEVVISQENTSTTIESTETPVETTENQE